jgi:hypothetical protein
MSHMCHQGSTNTGLNRHRRGLPLRAPNIRSDHSPSFPSSILYFPLIAPSGLQLCHSIKYSSSQYSNLKPGYKSPKSHEWSLLLDFYGRWRVGRGTGHAGDFPRRALAKWPQASFIASVGCTVRVGRAYNKFYRFSNNSNRNPHWILKGFKPFWRNSINSLKIFLRIIFDTTTLDWLTCIPNLKFLYMW